MLIQVSIKLEFCVKFCNAKPGLSVLKGLEYLNEFLSAHVFSNVLWHLRRIHPFLFSGSCSSWVVARVEYG